MFIEHIKMPNYSQGKIYKIVNDVNGKVYIGSTCRNLSARFAEHKYESKAVKKSPFYTAMHDIGCAHYSIILIKQYPCSSRSELEAEEYKTVDKMSRKGIILYNDRTSHGCSDATRLKLSKLRTKRGCLFFNDTGKSHCWKFSYNPALNTTTCVSFSIKKYGYEEAKAMAIAAQDKQYPRED